MDLAIKYVLQEWIPLLFENLHFEDVPLIYPGATRRQMVGGIILGGVASSSSQTHMMVYGVLDDGCDIRI